MPTPSSEFRPVPYRPTSRPQRRRLWVKRAVIAVLGLGLLAVIVVPLMSGEIVVSKRTIADSQMEQLGSAVERYHLTTGTIPHNLEQLVTGPDEWEGEWNPPINRIPDDPWGREYAYARFDDRRFLIFTRGADGKTGVTTGNVQDPDITYPRGGLGVTEEKP